MITRGITYPAVHLPNTTRVEVKAAAPDVGWRLHELKQFVAECEEVGAAPDALVASSERDRRIMLVVKA